MPEEHEYSISTQGLFYMLLVIFVLGAIAALVVERAIWMLA